MQSQILGKKMSTLADHGFHPITFEQYLERSKQDALLLQKRSRVLPKRKRVVRGRGRPVPQISINDSLSYHSTSSDDSLEGGSSKIASNRPSRYTCWFQPEFWSKIEAALVLHGHRFRPLVKYLQRKYVLPGCRPMFEGLNESIVRGWFEKDRRTLKKKAREAAAVVKCGLQDPRSVMRPGRAGVFDNHHEVELQFIDWIIQLRNTNVNLNSLLITFQMKAFLLARAPKVLVEHGGQFRVSRRQARCWARIRLGWSFRKPTTNANILPQDWKEKGGLLLLRVALKVAGKVIPQSLVVNADQTAMHLFPVGNEHTYTARGARDVSVIGRGDKRQVTVLLSCAATGEVLPSQCIFQGKTYRCLPKGPHAHRFKSYGWNLTFTAKHWSTLASMQEYVRCMFIPYVQKVCSREGLDFAKQESLLLLDYYSVHTGAPFCSWMQETYPRVNLIYIPGSCTSKLQPYDVVLQHPFKVEVHKRFSEFAVHNLTSQLATGKDASALCLDTQIGPLRNALCDWLFRGWDRLNEKEEMVKAGWARIGLLAAWETKTQWRAMRKNLESNLFDQPKMVEPKQEQQFNEKDLWYGDYDFNKLLDTVGREDMMNLENLETESEGEDADEYVEDDEDDDGYDDDDGDNNSNEFAQPEESADDIQQAVEQLLSLEAHAVNVSPLGASTPCRRW